MIKSWTGLRTLVKREIARFLVVYSQTLLPPLVSSVLFIFVFGYSIGRGVGEMPGGISYLSFMVPGLVTLNLVESSFTNACSTLYMSRWQNIIQEVLLSPLSYFEMVLGLLLGSVCRGILVGMGVYAVSTFFTPFQMHSPLVLAYFFIMVTVIFSCMGLIVGLWADGFEKLSFWSTFVLSPLIYFGGAFHHLGMVPEPLRFVTKLDPIFYFVNGIRYGMIGVSDADVRVGMLLAFVMAAGLFMAVERLFRIGYKLRT